MNRKDRMNNELAGFNLELGRKLAMVIESLTRLYVHATETPTSKQGLPMPSYLLDCILGTTINAIKLNAVPAGIADEYVRDPITKTIYRQNSITSKKS